MDIYSKLRSVQRRIVNAEHHRLKALLLSTMNASLTVRCQRSKWIGVSVVGEQILRLVIRPSEVSVIFRCEQTCKVELVHMQNDRGRFRSTLCISHDAQPYISARHFVLRFKTFCAQI